ncbi:MAG: hypothetical protein WC375_10795 [Methanomassiliicoccales archaeon]
MKLLVNKANLDWNFCTLGLNDIIGHLINSGKFEVGYHEEQVVVDRNFRATILIVEGKRIYVDFWEYSLPTYSKPVWDANFDLIIKLQHRSMTHEDFERECSHSKLFQDRTKEERKAFLDKIVPWTFFPSRMMMKYVGKENELTPLPTKQLSFFGGKYWKCRGPMIKKLQEQGIECLQSDRLEYKVAITDDEYLEKMRSSQFGVVLAGRRSGFTDSKNRREIDYMMMKKPLMINYHPLYYNPLVEGKHYIFIDTNNKLKDLASMYNIDEMTREAYEWYEHNATPQGVVESFVQILRERLGIQ